MLITFASLRFINPKILSKNFIFIALRFWKHWNDAELKIQRKHNHLLDWHHQGKAKRLNRPTSWIKPQNTNQHPLFWFPFDKEYKKTAPTLQNDVLEMKKASMELVGLRWALADQCSQPRRQSSTKLHLYYLIAYII